MPKIVIAAGVAAACLVLAPGAALAASPSSSPSTTTPSGAPKSRIVLPLSLPALATLAVIQFLWTWNDFLWPLVTIYKESAFTLQLGLMSFQGSHVNDTNLLMAGNVMSMLPMLILFIAAQRYFVRGIATQGLKG